MAATKNKGKDKIRELRAEKAALERQFRRDSNKAKSKIARLRIGIERKRKKIKSQQQQIRRLAKKMSAMEGLRSSPLEQKVRDHHYSLGMMWLAIVLYTQKNLSLRGTCAALDGLQALLGLPKTGISPNTVKSWCLRYGLALFSQKIPCGQYGLIMDESIAMGTDKLLLALLVPLPGDLSRTAPLCHRDVHVLELGVSNSWTGEKIAKKIEDALKRHEGVSLCYGISDKGTNLKKAYGLLGVERVDDCTHMMTNAIKSIFSKDKALNRMVVAVNGLQSKWTNSKNAPYLPPKMRKKGRYHQIFVLVGWAEKMEGCWADMGKDVQCELDFLKSDASLIGTMKKIKAMMCFFSELVKGAGLNRSTKAKWEAACIEILKNGNDQGYDEIKVGKFKDTVDRYLLEHQRLLDTMSQLLCTSDVIESVFGKYKNKGGIPIITEDILKIIGYTAEIDIEKIETFFIAHKVVDLQKWKSDNIPESFLKKRRNLSKKMAS